MLTRPKNPCRYCDDRSATCRLDCSEWKEYELERADFYEKQKKLADKNGMWADHMSKSKERAMKAKRRRH